VSARQYQGQLDRKRKQRVDAEKKLGEYRIKESNKRSAASKAKAASATTNSPSTARSKTKDAERREKEAHKAGTEANRWQLKAANYLKEEVALQVKLTSAQQRELAATEGRRAKAQQQSDRRARADSAAIQARMSETEAAVGQVIKTLRKPKPEKLRVLILGASSEGDLRVGREQSRIRGAVKAALHRDLIELDVRPAATTVDLLDGITGFRPHIVHFSGHSNENLIVFEDDKDGPHDGYIVSAEAFKRAVSATDDPPLLVLLNSCKSAAQLPALIGEAIPFAIGMSDSIEDGDAISYAAQFYSAIANGQSIQSAHFSGQAALELAGLSGADLPTLAHSEGVDPAQAILVTPT